MQSGGISRPGCLRRISANIWRKKPSRLITRVGHFTQIIQTGRVWGLTEGVVYALCPLTGISMADEKPDEGTIIWTGEARKLFCQHSWRTPWGFMKFVFGQYTGPFGDLQIETHRRVGSRLYVSSATKRRHAGQSIFMAFARRWTRFTVEMLSLSLFGELIAAFSVEPLLQSCVFLRFVPGSFASWGILLLASAVVRFAEERRRYRRYAQLSLFAVLGALGLFSLATGLGILIGLISSPIGYYCQ